MCVCVHACVCVCSCCMRSILKICAFKERVTERLGPVQVKYLLSIHYYLQAQQQRPESPTVILT